MDYLKENKLVSTEDLRKVFEQDNVYIFGAGVVGKYVLDYVADKEYQVKGILVTNKNGNPEEMRGIRVTGIQYAELPLGSMVVICTTEQYHRSIDRVLESQKNIHILYVSNKLFEQLRFIKGENRSADICDVKDAVREITYGYQRFIKRPCYELLVLNILDHCNLRCKGCDHFACIADPYFVSAETVLKDIQRMAEIFHGDYIMQIGVMGGEPLLHPELLHILKGVRQCFPFARVSIYTNGILLLKQSEEFWHTLKENNIGIMNTRYPIHLDFEGMKKKADEEGVAFQHYLFYGEKELFKKVINLKGSGDPVESFAKCHISNYGNFLMEGRIYSCPFSCQSYRIFNKKFNQNLRMTESDYLDIYKTDSMNDFFEFAARPKFYCRYCDGLRYGYKWTQSRKEMSEWVEEVKIKE